MRRWDQREDRSLAISPVRGWHLLHLPSRPSTECFRNDMRQRRTGQPNSPPRPLLQALPQLQGQQHKLTLPHPRIRPNTSHLIPVHCRRRRHPHTRLRTRLHISIDRIPSVRRCLVQRPSCWIGRIRRGRRDRVWV
ncbi:p21-activated kinase 1 [Cryptococcus neoformans D17-1]|nr:p21-activated kinase 1 [Cryptococcus neoformans var. grubii D17-1]